MTEFIRQVKEGAWDYLTDTPDVTPDLLKNQRLAKIEDDLAEVREMRELSW